MRAGDGGNKDGCAGSERYILECIFDGRKSFNGVGGKWGKDIRRFGFQCFWREHGFSSELTGFKQNRSIFKGSGRFGSPGAFIPGNPFDASLWQLSECGSDDDGFLPDSPISGNFRKWQMDGAGHPSGNFRCSPAFRVSLPTVRYRRWAFMSHIF